MKYPTGLLPAARPSPKPGCTHNLSRKGDSRSKKSTQSRSSGKAPKDFAPTPLPRGYWCNKFKGGIRAAISPDSVEAGLARTAPPATTPANSRYDGIPPDVVPLPEELQATEASSQAYGSLGWVTIFVLAGFRKVWAPPFCKMKSWTSCGSVFFLSAESSSRQIQSKGSAARARVAATYGLMSALVDSTVLR